MRRLLKGSVKIILGPGYSSPLEAFKNGEREKLLYVICINPEPETRKTPDYLATVDLSLIHI